MDEKQTTEKGAEIPVPTRKEWEQALRKVAIPKESPPDGPEKK